MNSTVNHNAISKKLAYSKKRKTESLENKIRNTDTDWKSNETEKKKALEDEIINTDR